MFRVLKDNRGIYVFINWRNLGLWITELEKMGFVVKNTIVWDKIVHGLNYQNYAHTYELIIFAVKGQCFPNNKRTEDRIKGYYKDIWHIQREVETTNEGEHHETVKKPFVVMLPLYHFTKEGDTILDPFAGSGTTGVACKKLNRNCIMIEIEPKHCEIIKKRIFNTQTDMFCGVEK